MNRKSVWAVAAGVLVVIVVTTAVDVLLHAVGVFPEAGQPLDNALSLLASSYRLVITVGAAWLTATLAPAKPMKHAMVLGAIGTLLGLAGVVATWNLDLGPRWYPVSIAVLAMPECWAGAKIQQRQSTPR
jgi:hypothetical protein